MSLCRLLLAVAMYLQFSILKIKSLSYFIYWKTVVSLNSQTSANSPTKCLTHMYSAPFDTFQKEDDQKFEEGHKQWHHIQLTISKIWETAEWMLLIDLWTKTPILSFLSFPVAPFVHMHSSICHFIHNVFKPNGLVTFINFSLCLRF